MKEPLSERFFIGFKKVSSKGVVKLYLFPNNLLISEKNTKEGGIILVVNRMTEKGQVLVDKGTFSGFDVNIEVCLKEIHNWTEQQILDSIKANAK